MMNGVVSEEPKRKRLSKICLATTGNIS